MKATPMARRRSAPGSRTTNAPISVSWVAQKKYDQTLRQLDEYRGGLAERLRRADDTIIEGEFQEDTVQERQGPAPESASTAVFPVEGATVAVAGSAGRRPRRRPADAAA